MVDISDYEIADNIDPESSFIDKENAEMLNSKIKTALSKLEYKVLTAYLTYGSYSAVAEALSVSQKDVNNALQRARKKIKKSIGNFR